MALSHEKKKELEQGQPHRRELCDLAQLRELKPEYTFGETCKREGRQFVLKNPQKKSQNLQVLYRKLCGAKTRGTGQKTESCIKNRERGKYKIYAKRTNY